MSDLTSLEISANSDYYHSACQLWTAWQGMERIRYRLGWVCPPTPLIEDSALTRAMEQSLYLDRLRSNCRECRVYQ